MGVGSPGTEDGFAVMDDERPDEPRSPSWQELVAAWRDLPEPEWDQERADRVFSNIMRSLERRERRRRIAWVAACAFLPFVGTVWLAARRRL